MQKELAIPPYDMPRYAALADEMKRKVDFWIAMARRIAESGRVIQAIADEARRHSHRAGCSAGSIRRMYYGICKHGWTFALDGRRHHERKLPPQVIEKFCSFCDRNQRKNRPAWRKFIRWLQGGGYIPDVGTWRDLWIAEHGPSNVPERCPADYVPRGWTYGNLQRHAPTIFEQTAARIGRSAAAAFRPLVFSSRVGLKVGQYIMFDDLWHDIQVNYIGVNRRSMRPLELCAIDVFSGCKFAYGLKPMMETDEGTQIRLKEREMLFLLAHILSNIGYRADGTMLLVEHGTATIREDLERRLHDWTGGAIRVNRSGIDGAAAFAGVFEGRPKGNFRFKALLESSHGLFHNEIAQLPGQMGSARDRQPEEFYGRDKHNQALIKAMAALPAERAKMLALPFLEWNQYFGIYSDLVNIINGRTWHKLEGWIEAGLVSHEYRLADHLPWLPAESIASLPPHERALVNSIAAQPGRARVRRLSPAEVFDRGRVDLERLPHCFAPLILGRDNGVERRVTRQHLFEFEDRDLGPATYRYTAEMLTQEGRTEILKPGNTYLTHVIPFNPQILYISRPDGAFLGVCRAWETVRKDATEALHRQMGAAARLEKKLLAPIARRGADLVRERIAAAQNNAAVLAGVPITPDEKDRAVALRDFQPADLLAEPVGNSGVTPSEFRAEDLL